MVRLQLVWFVAFAMVQIPSIGRTQTPLIEERLWSSSDGKQLKAAVVGHDSKTVTLAISNRPDPVTVPRERFSKSDQRLLNNLWYDHQDRAQFQQVKEQLRNVTEQPDAAAGLLIALHNQYSESPYAGLWASVTLCLGRNEHTRAESMLRQTILRIKNQQENDPTRHRMTLCSANNNLAVCMIKARKGDSAATRMIDAIGLSKTIPAVVSANARLLNECTADVNSGITFSPSVRLRLLESVALANSAGGTTGLAQGWHYSLDFDVPSDAAAATKIAGIDAPRAGLRLISSGSGVVVAPGIVLTSRRVLETTNYRGSKLVTVLSKNKNEEHRSETVDGVLMERGRLMVEGGLVGFSSDNYQEVWTSFNWLQPSDGDSGAELAALRVPGLATVPVAISEQDCADLATISIFGYGRGPQMLSNGVLVQEGQVSVPSGLPTSRSLSTTARVVGGNRGGPVIDQEGIVVGIAHDTPESGLEAQGLLFGAQEIRRWFYKNVQTAQLLDVDSKENANSRIDKVKAATLPVLVWGRDEGMAAPIFSQVADNSRAGGGLYLRDSWCLSCDGKGFMDCSTNGCNKGAVPGRVTVDMGVDPVSGTRRTATKVTKERCDACNGKGVLACPHCRAGRI